jgi:large subunit ribosomal protein L9
MQVILLEKVHHLGNLGDNVTVRPGYARNFLIPQGKAILATEKNLANFEAKRAELEKAQGDKLSLAQSQAAQLKSVKTVAIGSKVGSEGKLFGSVSAADIASALSHAGIKVTKQSVRLPNGPLRYTGDYEVTVHLHPDVSVNVKVQVVSEDVLPTLYDVELVTV